jgi:hypothetical protein
MGGVGFLSAGRVATFRSARTLGEEVRKAVRRAERTARRAGD